MFPKTADYLQPDAVCTAAGTEKEADIFCGEEAEAVSRPTITHGQYQADRLSERQEKPCAAARTDRLLHGASHWRGLRPDLAGHQSGRAVPDGAPQYAVQRHKAQDRDRGRPKRSKVRTVDFCDTLAEILRAAKVEQHKNRFKYGELYHLNYYTAVKEKDHSYYEVYSLPRTAEVPEGYKRIILCLRQAGRDV